MKILVIIIAAAACFLVAMGINSSRALAADESSVEADVTVVSPSDESYGSDVAGSRLALLSWRALGEPDGRGAYILRSGWMEIELDGTVSNAETVSIWASDVGFWHSNVKVYVSSDGGSWERIGTLKVENSGYRRFDFSAGGGSVRYIKVERSGTPLSFLLLDAVRAKGGD
jgi:hypothetical protein